MKPNAAIALALLGFYALIGLAVYFTGSAVPLWALLLTPSIEWEKENPKP